MGYPMKLKFCGAAGTTTGSQHLLEINGQKILLDCGLYQGHRKDQYEINGKSIIGVMTLAAKPGLSKQESAIDAWSRNLEER